MAVSCILSSVKNVVTYKPTKAIYRCVKGYLVEHPGLTKCARELAEC